ncbi:hypothetical protein [Metabacillus malikii]|uniref:Uncharacterized protein n=1 Tax=Metabacillus malikii TaxID=1504265 RepID=A0ABT9ZLG7_9BACI|nr:hypothetical protein [Metabacillus malikii]MDQ0233140.1 hypothetical protein [Metabacillus malikii]
MSQFWLKYGKVITLLVYSVFMLCQVLVGLLVFEDLKTKIVMITLQVIMTSIVFFIAYKITNRMLEK